MTWQNSPIIIAQGGYKILGKTKSEDIYIFENKDTKTHRSRYSIDGEILFETSKAKAKAIEEFIRSLQQKVVKIYSGKSKKF